MGKDDDKRPRAQAIGTEAGKKSDERRSITGSGHPRDKQSSGEGSDQRSQ